MIRTSLLPYQRWWAFLLVGLLLFVAQTTLWAQATPPLPVVDTHTDQAYRQFMPVVLGAPDRENDNARGKLPPVQPQKPTATPSPTPSPLPTVAPPIAPSSPLTTAISLTWEFQFAVANSELATQWVMKAVADDGTTTIVQRVDLSKSCSINGAVDLIGTQANFAGGYIACNLPDFATEAQNYITTVSECDCDFDLLTPPWVAAVFAVSGTTGADVQPLVAVENGFRYEIRTLHPADGYTRLVFDSENALAGPSFLLADGQVTFTGYNPAWVLHTLIVDPFTTFLHDVAFTQAAMNTPDYAFLSWLPTQSVVATPALDYAMNPSPTTIYVGGEPGSSARFIGTIDKLILDPGCRGFGNGDGT